MAGDAIESAQNAPYYCGPECTLLLWHCDIRGLTGHPVQHGIHQHVEISVVHGTDLTRGWAQPRRQQKEEACHSSSMVVHRGANSMPGDGCLQGRADLGAGHAEGAGAQTWPESRAQPQRERKKESRPQLKHDCASQCKHHANRRRPFAGGCADLDAGHAEGAGAHPPALPGMPLLRLLPGVWCLQKPTVQGFSRQVTSSRTLRYQLLNYCGMKLGTIRNSTADQVENSSCQGAGVYP